MIMDIFRKVMEEQKVYCGECSGEMKTAEVTDDSSGNHEVFRFDTEYHLSSSQTKGISDHYPIWAEFYTDRDTDH